MRGEYCLSSYKDAEYNQLNSIWVFVLLGIEGMKTFKANPYFVYVQLCFTPINELSTLQYKHNQNTHLDYTISRPSLCDSASSKYFLPWPCV